MEEKKIIIVEDETLVSNDIRESLKNVGYKIVSIFNSGEEILNSIEELDELPDLILMDIRLKGKIDGIKAAKEIRKKYDIPIIFLTAFCDNDTLDRAKEASPFGYIIKPYNEKELYATIEVALYKHKADKILKEREEWINAILKSIGDALIATDSKGHILFMNEMAEKLTGWKAEEVKGKKMNSLFKILEDDENSTISSFDSFSSINISENLILVARNGEKIKIRENATPIKDEKGNIKGIVVIFYNREMAKV